MHLDNEDDMFLHTKRWPNCHHLCHHIQQHLHFPYMQEIICSANHYPSLAWYEPRLSLVDWGMSPPSHSAIATSQHFHNLAMLHSSVIWLWGFEETPPNLPVPSLTLCVASKASPADSWSWWGVQWWLTLLGLPWVSFSRYALYVVSFITETTVLMASMIHKGDEQSAVLGTYLPYGSFPFCAFTNY